MNKSTKKFIAHHLPISVLVLFSAGVWSFANAATTYHVRKDGNDTTCNGSANAPSASTPNCAFLTVQNGLKAAQAADTVSIHAGDYSTATITSVRTGTASARITISAAPGETATLGSTDILSGHNYITMSGLNFAGFPNGTKGNGSAELIDIKGTNFTYTNNHMQPNNAGSYGVARGIRTHATYTTISNSTFEAGTVVNGPSFYNVITLDNGGDYALIDHNVIKNMIDVERVFELWSKNPTYSNNEIYNLKSTGPNWSHPDIWQTWSDSRGGTSVSNFLAENNYIHDVQSQIGILEGDANPHANGPWVFRNNVFANVDSCMFMGSWKIYWYNNTFYRASLNCPHPIYSGVAGSDNFDVRNNVFVGSGDTNGNGWYAFDSGTADYNFVATVGNSAKGGFSETHGINGGNPIFVNAQSDCVNNVCDFHIASGSILKDKGVTIGSVSSDGSAIPLSSADKDGNNRTGTWDMGAYEFGSSGLTSPGSGNNTLMMPPTNLKKTL
jgi:hypothetical protein